MIFDDWIKQYQTKKIYLFKIDIQNATEQKYLYLATEPYFDGTNFYEPLIKGMPFFKRTVQEAVYGMSQISFGQLQIITAGNVLDSELINYNWNGRNIEIKLGGDDIPYTEFRTILTGYMGPVKYDDISLTIPIFDKQVALMKRFPDTGIYNGNVGDVVHAILNNIGIDDTQIDLTMLNTLNTDYPYNVYVNFDGQQNAKMLFDALLTPMLFWWGFNRSGLFQIGAFTGPGVTAEMNFDDVEILSFSQAIFEKQYWKIKLSYISNTAADPVTRTDISNQDATIKDIYPLAMESGVKNTYLTVAADANAVLNRWWDLLSVARNIISLRLKVQPFALELNDTIGLSRARFLINGNYKIISAMENYNNNYVELECFK